MKEGSCSKGMTKCLVVTFSVVIAVVLLVMILALTVFKPRHPISTVDSIRLLDMNTSMDLFRMKVDVNLTLDVDVSVTNTNKFGFKYSDGSALLNYRGQWIGEAPIPNGELSSDETKGVNLTLTVMADRLISNSELSKDVASGTLSLNTLVRISGLVKILGFIKFHVGSTSSCDFIVSLSNNTVVDNECKYKTKI